MLYSLLGRVAWRLVKRRARRRRSRVRRGRVPALVVGAAAASAFWRGFSGTRR